MPTPQLRATLQIHACVVVWGFTAILGRLISLPALALVTWRMGLVALLLVMLPRVRRSLGSMTRSERLGFAGIGLVVAVHWVTFYAAVKLALAGRVGCYPSERRGGVAPRIEAVITVLRHPARPAHRLVGSETFDCQPHDSRRTRR